jgi:hypothetical protein
MMQRISPPHAGEENKQNGIKQDKVFQISSDMRDKMNKLMDPQLPCPASLAVPVLSGLCFQRIELYVLYVQSRW